MKFKLLKQRLSFKKRVFGFTLLEVLIVIALTATIAGVGISSYVGQQRVKLLDNTVQEIVGFLRYAQQKSIAQEQGGQWGVRFENSLEEGNFYTLNFDPDSGAFQDNYNLVKIIKDKILSFFRPFYAFARVITETERHYLPSGIKYQTPEDNDHVYVLFQSLTGFLSLGGSYPQQPYQQIILEDATGKTANIVVCKQGLITYNEDIGICGELDFTPPEIGEIIASNTSFGSYVSSPFKLSTTIHEPEGKLAFCEYTVNGSDWHEATISGTGPQYTCSKLGIVAEDRANLTLNMRATSEGGIGIGSPIIKTVDAKSPTCSDNWVDEDWITAPSVNVSMGCNDDGSGVDSIKYCVDTGNTCSPSISYTSPVTISCEPGSTCVQYIRYQSKDKVGNTSQAYYKRIRQDRQAPIDGNLSAIPDMEKVSLSWETASDGPGSGLASSGTYKLVYSMSGTPSANCTDGTQIYLGTERSYTHTDLADETTYYYRVCAYDKVGNISIGSINSAKTKPDKLANGVICTSADQCLSDYCYVDNDGDRYAPSSGTKKCQPLSQLAGVDCDDNNKNIYPGKVVSVKSCSSNNYYYIDGDNSPTGTDYCRYRYYSSQNRICLADGTVSDPPCSDYCTQTKATCGPCTGVRVCNSSSQSCGNYGGGTRCGEYCDVCHEGKCCYLRWTYYKTIKAKIKSWGPVAPCTYEFRDVITTYFPGSWQSCTGAYPTSYTTGLLYENADYDQYKCTMFCP
ncbi:MAG: prepilin-type N-terminal cleavage/methylation domain-containing protein [Candidatus Pacebacteria bacterium]|nr:prepilin-type N-terminal cleavage/methylation domain-containing protein [Candidatus Paceibacterota bacterium]MDD5721823.1 prepilin-type N-terminal cleavage/methylation domain-containing protein [Candidatus Paceibacterota bacterium]NMA48172.1 hypothetical protein [Tissierellia bacterium]